MRFLGLAKICMNQIRKTEVISNQKRMSEGTYVVKITSFGHFGKLFEMRMSENQTIEIHRSQGSSVNIL